MTTTPAWLQAHTTRTGDDPRLIGNKAQPRTCKTCTRLTLTGYDAPLLAFIAICDPYVITTPELEYAAHILGRSTYQLWGQPGRYELTNRTRPTMPIRYPGPPANQPGIIVLASHDCPKPPLTDTPIPVSQPQLAALDPTSPPPF